MYLGIQTQVNKETGETRKRNTETEDTAIYQQEYCERLDVDDAVGLEIENRELGEKGKRELKAADIGFLTSISRPLPHQDEWAPSASSGISRS
jgi:hypothetical protein